MPRSQCLREVKRSGPYPSILRPVRIHFIAPSRAIAPLWKGRSRLPKARLRSRHGVVDFAWTVPTLTANRGETVTFVNGGLSVHTFSVSELGATIPLPVGESTTWTVPADAVPGTYTFVCAEPGHEALGMVGTVTVI